MIYAIKGSPLHMEERKVALQDASGVCWEINVSDLTWESVYREGMGEVTLLIHHHFTDTNQSLHGFLSTGERNMFRLLMTVQSVGPSVAHAVMSVMDCASIIEAVERQDAKAFEQATGVGKTLSEKIVFQLKGIKKKWQK